MQLISCYSLAERSLTFLLFAGRAVEAQLVPISTFVQSLPGRESTADSELVFLAAQLPPLGSKSYHVERTLKRSRTSAVKSKSKLKAAGRRGWRADSVISSDVIFLKNIWLKFII